MKRLKKIHEILKKEGLDALLISSSANIQYLTYFSGFFNGERDAFLVITKTKNYLLTDKRYSGSLGDLDEFEILDEGALRTLKSDFFKKNRIRTLGFESKDLKVYEYSLLKNRLKTKEVDLDYVREVKEDAELQQIQNACSLADKAFGFILKKIKTGISEQEIAFEIEHYIKRSGQDISFSPIVAFGPNSSVPHHKSGPKKLKKDEIVLIDFGAKFNSYCSDITRTVFFGKADNTFRKVYETVLNAQQLAIDKININARLSDIDKTARDYIKREGFLNIPHAIGHGVGLEVHELPHVSPYSKEKMVENQIFTVEPGIYIENWGGIRIEDVVLVGKNGPQLITDSNRSLIEI
jgi:Xaa-Pro aminopeptidase